MYATNLADIARRTGFPVVEQPGWKTRGHGGITAVRSVICHHDAAKQSPTTFNSVVQNGRSGLPGPLAQFTIRRDGTIHVVAAGLSYHAGATINDSLYSNSYSLGIEAGNDGLGEPWPRVQLDAYEALCAELCKAFGLSVDRVRGHKEIAAPLGRKPDPRGIDMNAFRNAVSARMKGGGGSTPGSEDDLQPDERNWLKSVYDTIFGNDNPKFDRSVLSEIKDKVRHNHGVVGTRYPGTAANGEVINGVWHGDTGEVTRANLARLEAVEEKADRLHEQIDIRAYESQQREQKLAADIEFLRTKLIEIAQKLGES